MGVKCKHGSLEMINDGKLVLDSTSEKDIKTDEKSFTGVSNANYSHLV